MANNKVIYNGNTLIDLTADTVTENDVLNGKTFHKANGDSATGTGVGPDTITDCRYLFSLNNNRIDQLINTKIITDRADHMFYRNVVINNTKFAELINNPNYTWTLSNNDLTGFMEQCISMTTFDFNNINTKNLALVLGSAFKNCTNLTSIIFKTMIARNISEMLSSCTRLTDVDMSNVDNVYTDASATNAFYNCSSLQTITLNPNISNAYEYVSGLFSNCNNLTTINNLDKNIKSVRDCEKLFFSCNSLTNINLPYLKLDKTNRCSLNSMFYNCFNIQTIDLLWDCSVYNAYDTGYMFQGCNSLENLIIRWTGGVPVITSYDTISGIPSTCNIYVPDALVDTYKTATNWTYKASQIKPLSEYVEE